MIYRVYTYAQFEQFLREKKANHRRSALLKDWMKWREEKLVATCVLCDHRDASGALTLKEWDCGCSYGCEACNVNYKCTSCGGSFDHPNAASSAFSSWLEFPATAPTVMSGN